MSPRPLDAGATPARRVNILFLTIQMSGMGGSERLVLDLVKQLDRRVFNPSVAWLVGDRPLDALQELGVPLHYIPKRRRFDWRAMTGVARLIADQQIDIVNAHHFMSFVYAYYGARVANRARLVYTEHSENDVMQVTGKWAALGRWLLPSCSSIGISADVSRRLGAHFRLPPGAVHTIENGVDLSRFEHLAATRDTARAQLGVAPDDIVIGHVANFKKNKNHLFLLKAFHQIAQRAPGVKLVFVGRGFAGEADNSEPDVVRYIRENGLGDRVQVTGYRADVPALLSAMDIFCLVSYREGLPLGLIEGMAARLPVIGTAIDGIRGVVQPEVNGLLVEPDDVEALAAAIVRLAGDAAGRARMGAASARLAADKYSLSRCIEASQQVFLSGRAPAVAPVSTPTVRMIG